MNQFPTMTNQETTTPNYEYADVKSSHMVVRGLYDLREVAKWKRELPNGEQLLEAAMENKQITRITAKECLDYHNLALKNGSTDLWCSLEILGKEKGIKLHQVRGLVEIYNLPRISAGNTPKLEKEDQVSIPALQYIFSKATELSNQDNGLNLDDMLEQVKQEAVQLYKTAVIASISEAIDLTAVDLPQLKGGETAKKEKTKTATPKRKFN